MPKMVIGVRVTSGALVYIVSEFGVRETRRSRLAVGGEEGGSLEPHAGFIFRTNYM